MENNNQTWESFILTFPFWIFLKMHPIQKTGLVENKTRQVNLGHDFKACYSINWHGRKARVYLPFRSAPANYLPMPVPEPAVIKKTGLRFKPDVVFPRLAIVLLPAMDENSEPRAQIERDESWSCMPEPFPMDSMRIDIQGAEDGLAAAQGLARLILRHIRLETEQWWITRSMDAYTTYVRAIFKTDPEGLSYHRPYTEMRGLWGFERPLTPEGWYRVIGLVINDVAPDFAQELLMDAYFHCHSNNLDNAIMFAAIACENAVENACSQIWERKHGGTSKFKRDKVLRSNNKLPNNLSKDLERFVGRDFSNDDPESFKLIQELWILRGKVAHGGHAIVRRENKTRRVTFDVARELLSAARNCLNWLKTL